MRLFDEAVKGLQGAEEGIDGAVVLHIVAKIFHGGLEERRDPDGIGAKRLDVLQAALDPAEIPDAIPVAVLKRPGINLINYPGFPPGLGVISSKLCARTNRGSLGSSRHGEPGFLQSIDPQMQSSNCQSQDEIHLGLDGLRGPRKGA